MHLLLFIVLCLLTSPVYSKDQNAQVKRLQKIIKKQQNEIKLLKLTSGKANNGRSIDKKNTRKVQKSPYNYTRTGSIDPLEITYP